MKTNDLIWLTWFAWRPVRDQDNRWHWLKRIEYRPQLRVLVFFCLPIPHKWTWEYRPCSFSDMATP